MESVGSSPACIPTLFGLQSSSGWLDTLSYMEAVVTRSTIRFSPPNSLLFISDPEGGVAPYPETGPLILSTPSCISFGCMMEQDGETEVSIGIASEVDPGETPA